MQQKNYKPKLRFFLGDTVTNEKNDFTVMDILYEHGNRCYSYKLKCNKCGKQGNITSKALSRRLNGKNSICDCRKVKISRKGMPAKPGDKKNKLLFLSEAGKNRNGYRIINVKCNCGNVFSVTYSSWYGGTTKTCKECSNKKRAETKRKQALKNAKKYAARADYLK